jgi:hypothetical protein
MATAWTFQPIRPNRTHVSLTRPTDDVVLVTPAIADGRHKQTVRPLVRPSRCSIQHPSRSVRMADPTQPRFDQRVDRHPATIDTYAEGLAKRFASTRSCRDWIYNQVRHHRGFCRASTLGLRATATNVDRLEANDLSVRRPTAQRQDFRRSSQLSSRRFRRFRIRYRLHRGGRTAPRPQQRSPHRR